MKTLIILTILFSTILTVVLDSYHCNHLFFLIPLGISLIIPFVWGMKTFRKGKTVSEELRRDSSTVLLAILLGPAALSLMGFAQTFVQIWNIAYVAISFSLVYISIRTGYRWEWTKSHEPL